MREGWREVKRWNLSQGRVGMDWDNGFDQVEIKVFPRERLRCPSQGKINSRRFGISQMV